MDGLDVQDRKDKQENVGMQAETADVGCQATQEMTCQSDHEDQKAGQVIVVYEAIHRTPMTWLPF